MSARSPTLGLPALALLPHKRIHMNITRGDAAAADGRERQATGIDIVIADDHPLVLAGFEPLGRQETDLRVVQRATSATDAINAVLARKPSVLLVDLELGEESGLSVIRAIRGRTNTRVILMATDLGEDDAIEALRLGVQGS